MSDLIFASNLIIGDKKVKEVPCIIGNGAPTAYTHGFAGVLYLDNQTKKLYVSPGTLDGETTWNIIVEVPEIDTNNYISPSDLTLTKGAGDGSFQQIADGAANGFEFNSEKNPNAVELDSSLDTSLTGHLIDYGATGYYSASFGGKSAAMGRRAFSEGTTTIAKGDYSHAEGNNAVSLGIAAHAEGSCTTAKGGGAHSEGNHTVALGENSHAEGQEVEADGMASHAEGYQTKTGTSSSTGVVAAHAEGRETVAEGRNSHAEGFKTQAAGDSSHAEGSDTIAKAGAAHAEGKDTKIYRIYSHAEGWNNRIGKDDGTVDVASTGRFSHVEGRDNVVTHDCAHVGGQGNKSSADCQTVIGKYCEDDSNALLIIGNGSSSTQPSNALKVLKNGNVDAKGLMYFVYTDRNGPHTISLKKILTKLIDKNIVSLSEVEGYDT